MILGITGKIASGKTTLAEAIARAGSLELTGKIFPFPAAQILEVDRLGHALLSDAHVKKRLIEAFGPEISEDGEIGRSRLARLAFADQRSLERLEEIIHPPMFAEFRRQVEAARSQNINLIAVAALPKRFQFAGFCDHIIPLTIDKEAALERIKNRSQQLPLPLFATIWERQAREYP